MCSSPHTPDYTDTTSCPYTFGFAVLYIATRARYFTSMPGGDDGYTLGSDDIFTPGSNCMSTTSYASNCTFTSMYVFGSTTRPDLNV